MNISIFQESIMSPLTMMQFFPSLFNTEVHKVNEINLF